MYFHMYCIKKRLHETEHYKMFGFHFMIINVDKDSLFLFVADKIENIL
jgi:hypothetical protein